jgi:DNA-nicking Smr family endonuclease
MSKRDTDIEDDAELWARVTRTARPLKTDRVTRVAAPSKPKQPSERKTARASVSEARPKPAAAAPSGSGLDRQTARKLGSGRLAVEARLDLHGLRQRDAHTALRKFLKRAQAQDYRHVLVITGKGASREEPTSFYEHERRGVLREAVPRWLSRGDLAPLIVSFSEAPRRLGGEGALYVRLRRPQRAQRKPKE